MPSGVYVRTKEQCAKISAALKGRAGTYVRTEEIRAKISAAGKGRILSPETRVKMSVANKGKQISLEQRAKISATLMGHPMSLETRAKMSAAEKGRTLPKRWRGGHKVSIHRANAKRRALGFVPLNKPFVACEGHHVDNEQVIYMPKELHRSIYHRQTDGRGMGQMNAIAYNFLFKQEVEVAIKLKGEVAV